LKVEWLAFASEMKVENPIAERSFTFALQIVELYKLLSLEREFVLFKQLLRSGTSTGANVAEAGAAISRRDFAAKMSIASKEARETRYWLMLLTQGGLTQIDLSFALNEVNQLINILTAIVKTSQANLE
jgi:four helix bundle protein